MKCKKYFRTYDSINRDGKTIKERDAVEKNQPGAELCDGHILVKLEKDPYDDGDRLEIVYLCEKCKCRIYEPGMLYCDRDVERYLQSILDENNTWPKLLSW